MATVVGVASRGDERTFEVQAWPTDRRLVLYVPEIEAATSVGALAEADAAARSLIADLTGLDESVIRCDIRLSRTPGRLTGPPPAIP